MEKCTPTSHQMVPNDDTKLVTIECGDCAVEANRVVALLKRDYVVLIKDVAVPDVQSVIRGVAQELRLLDRLEFQAAFANFVDRERVGDYTMTVTKRGDYQLITPHSEGTSLTKVQLASLYCFENTTDGGESILMNVDDSSDAWAVLREKLVRIVPGSRSLTPNEMRQAQGMYEIHSSPYLLDTDQILQKRSTKIPGLNIADVLAKPYRIYSSILDRDVYACWASIAVHDKDAFYSYVSLLKRCDLLREPPDGIDLRQMDTTDNDRVWSSGIDYNRLFKCKITRKLSGGDLVIMNNLTWTHSATNWTPGWGVRNIVAAFA